MNLKGFHIRSLMLSLVSILLLSACGKTSVEIQMRRAVRLYENGQIDRAEERFSGLLEGVSLSKANQAVLFNYLGLIDWKQGDLQSAEAQLRRSLELDPGLPDPVYNLAMLRYEEGRMSEAESLMTNAAQRDPEDPRALEWLSIMRLESKRGPDARRALTEAMGRAGGSPRILTALANVELLEGRPKDAVTFLWQALEIESDYPPALYNLAVIYDRYLDDPEQAVASYKDYLEVAEDKDRIAKVKAILSGDPIPEPLEEAQAVSVRQDQPTTPQPTQAQQVANFLQKAETFKERGMDAVSLNYCLLAAEHAGSNAHLREQALRRGIALNPETGRAYHEYARYLEGQRRPEEALNNFKKATSLDPSTKHFHLDLAAFAMTLNEADVALASLTKAQELDPMDAETAWQIAQLMDQQELKDKAVAAYNQFLQRFPQDPRKVQAAARIKELRPPVEVRSSLRTGAASSAEAPQNVEARPRDTASAIRAFNRGTAYYTQQDDERAVFFFKRALELDPQLVQAQYNLGLSAHRTGDRAEAEARFKEVNALRPDFEDAYYNLALVYHDSGRLQESVNTLKKLTRLNPDYARAYYLAGVIFSKNPNQYDQAKSYYQRYLSLAPENDLYVGAARRWMTQNP